MPVDVGFGDAERLMRILAFRWKRITSLASTSRIQKTSSTPCAADTSGCRGAHETIGTVPDADRWPGRPKRNDHSRIRDLRTTSKAFRVTVSRESFGDNASTWTLAASRSISVR